MQQIIQIICYKYVFLYFICREFWKFYLAAAKGLKLHIVRVLRKQIPSWHWKLFFFETEMQIYNSHI